MRDSLLWLKDNPYTDKILKSTKGNKRIKKKLQSLKDYLSKVNVYLSNNHLLIVKQQLDEYFLLKKSEA